MHQYWLKKKSVKAVSILLIMCLFNLFTPVISFAIDNTTATINATLLTPEIAVRTGSFHNLATSSDGTLWSWGMNNYGQLGVSSKANKYHPVRVKEISGVVSTAGGKGHSVALKSDGTVWTWGLNDYGQLGIGSKENKKAPVQVIGLANIIAIAAGENFTMALKNDGTVWTWGQNNYGQLGTGFSDEDAHVNPIKISGLININKISAGRSHALALDNNGIIWAWGNNSFGQLGDGTTNHRFTAEQVAGITTPTLIEAGYDNSMIVKNGEIWAWGANNFGQLGDGTTENRTIPVKAGNLSGIRNVSAGLGYTVAIKDDGTVYSWGHNDYGQLGDGTKVDKNTPGQVQGIINAIAIDCGENHTVVTGKDGKVWAWGRNSEGELGDLSKNNSTTPVNIYKLSLTAPYWPQVEGEKEEPLIIVDPTPAITNNNILTVSGIIGEDATVKINGELATILGNSFNKQINLTEGTNTIYITATEEEGETTTVIRTVILDTIAPALTVEDTIPNYSIFTVKGTVETGATVTVNGQVAVVSGTSYEKVIALNVGINVIEVVATDAAGNKTTITKTYEYNNQMPPQLTLTSPADNLITNNNILLVTGSTEAGSLIQVNGTPVMTDPLGNISTTINLIEGNNIIKIVAIDKAGNSTEIIRNVVLDTIAPILNVDNTPELTNKNQISVTGSVEVGSGVTVNGEAVTLNGTVMAKDVTLHEGVNIITIIATDQAGNISVVTRQVVCDTTAPSLIVYEPVDNLLTNNNLLLVNGLAEAGSKVLINGNNVVCDAVGNFTSFFNLVEGNNIITITATDTAGNTTVVTRMVVLDTTPPLLNVADTPALTGSNSIIVSGTVEGGASVQINGADVLVNGTTFDYTVHLVEGSNAINVIATDTAGNITSVIRNVVCDLTAPVLTITSPADNLLTNKSSVSVIGNTELGSMVKVNDIIVSTNMNGDFSFDVNLMEGINTINVISTDAVGNATLVTRSIINDTTPPAMVVNQTPALTNKVIVTISGSVEADAMITVNGQVTAVQGGNFSQDVMLNEGNNLINIIATDAAGNTTIINRTIELDTVPPYINVAQTPDITNNKLLNISGNIETGSLLSVNGEAVTLNGNVFSKEISLIEGNNTITVVAQDAAGNKTIVTRNIMLDTVAPNLIVNDTPALTNNPVLNVSGTTESGVIVTINGENPSLNGTAFNKTLTLVEGVNTINVVATDAAGNTTTITKTVTLDTQAPSVTIDTTPDLTNKMLLTITGTVEAGATVTVNGEAVIANGATYSKDIILSEGNNSIIVVATDAAGNVTTVSRTVVCDTVAPTLIITAPADNLLTNINTVTVTGNTEAGSVVNINGNPVAVDIAGNFGQIVNLTQGANVINIEATDAAGNKNQKNINITLDSVDPNLIIVSPVENSLTNNKTLIVSGYTEVGSAVVINGNKVDTDLLGNFSNVVNLNEGINTINIVATDAANNSTTVTRQVVVDTQPPSLTVDATASLASSAVLTVTGTVEAGASVSVNGESATVNGTTFAKDVNLVEGANAIQIIAKDAAGNLTTVNRKVVYLLSNNVTDLTVNEPVNLSASTTFKYTTSQNGYISINIYKQNGENVKLIYNNLYRISGTNYASWDGHDNNGVRVPDGYYRIEIECKDASGKLIGYADKTILAACTPKVTGAISTPDYFNPLNNEQATVTYTLSDDANVTVAILKGTTTIKTISKDEFRTAGNNQFVWDGKDDSGNIVADATYTYQIDTTSPIVPSFKTTYKGNTTVEKEPPQISGFSASPDPYKLQNSSLTISYNLSENAKVTINILDGAGNPVRNVQNSLSKLAGYNVTAWDGKDNNGNYVPEGIYTVDINAIDNFNKPSIEQKITVTAAYQPAISNISAAPDPFNPLDTVNNNTTISYSISKDAMVTVTIFKYSTPVRTIITSQRQSAGINSVIWDGRDNNGNIVGDGNYSYKIEASSPLVAGFKSSLTGYTNVEKEPPQITGFGVYTNPFKLQSTKLTINYNLSEKSLVTLKIVDVVGNPVRTLLNAVTKIDGANSSIWDGKDDSGNYVADGSYTIIISAVDSYNKPSGEQTITITAAYQPTINNGSATPNPLNPLDPVDNIANISYSLSKDAVVTVNILSGSNIVRNLISNQSQAGGVNCFQWDGKDNNGNIVPDEKYTYQIDAASPLVPSFKSTYMGYLNVDKEPPQITGFAVYPDPDRLNGGVLTIAYTISEKANVNLKIVDSAGNPVRILMNSVTKIAGSYNNYWDGKDDLGNYVPEGIYSAVISAVDVYNKFSGEQSKSFTAGYAPIITNNTVTPAPFDPANGNAMINFDLSMNAKVSVTILNNTTPIRTIITGSLMSAGTNSVNWDGKDDNGILVGDATYSYQIKATNPSIESFNSTLKGNITVEASNPLLTNLSTIPTVVKIGTNAVLSYTLSEAATVSVDILNSRGELVRNAPAVYKFKAGTYYVTWDTKDYSGNYITSGDYIMRVTATDNYGKVGTAEATFQAATVPVISLDANNPNLLDVSTGGQVTIVYNVTEKSYININIYDPNNRLWKPIYTNKEVAPGTDNFVWNGANSSGQLVNGIYTYKIDATSVIGGFKATQVTGTIQITGAP